MNAQTRTDQHDRVCTMLGHALTLGCDAWAWNSLSVVLRVRLSALERGCLLLATIRAMHPDDVRDIVDAALPEQMAGPPLPVLDQVADDARWWADLASAPEIEAWLAACFVRLSPREKQTFLAAATQSTAA